MSRRHKPGDSSKASLFVNGKGNRLSQSPCRLLHYDEIPSWQQESEYILSGYRPTSGSIRKSLADLLYINNETVSTYSHLFGSLLFATFPYIIYLEFSGRYYAATAADLVVFSTFFYGVAICFLLSATCHIIWNHSPSYAFFGNQLDYLGAILLMWGSTIPTVYYGFYCDPHLQKLYWAMISFLAIGCSIITLNPRFCHPTYRSYRAAMYTGLGLSAIVFTAHGLMLHGWEAQNRRMAIDWMALMTAFNLVGAFFYATRIPEVRYPYKFDTYGGSHQIFHLMVIFAGLAHMFGLLRAFDYTRFNVQGQQCI